MLTANINILGSAGRILDRKTATVPEQAWANDQARVTHLSVILSSKLPSPPFSTSEQKSGFQTLQLPPRAGRKASSVREANYLPVLSSQPYVHSSGRDENVV